MPMAIVHSTFAGFKLPPAIVYSHAPSHSRSNRCKLSYIPHLVEAWEDLMETAPAAV